LPRLGWGFFHVLSAVDYRQRISAHSHNRYALGSDVPPLCLASPKSFWFERNRDV
jgi:hypothetical protein